MLKNKMPTEHAVRLLVAASMSLLLASCAITAKKDNNSNRADTTNSSQSATSATSGTLYTPPAQQASEAQIRETDPGINREGRVIRLGTVREAVPEFEPPANDSIELNYEQEDLRKVLEQLGSALGISMIIDPTIDQKISMRTSAEKPLRYADIWPLMRLLARNAGVTIEQVGSVYELRRNASQVPVEIVMPETLVAAGSSEVLQITPLTYMSVESAINLLKPILQPEGSVISLGTANLIGINGSPEKIARINALLKVLDDDPFQNRGIRLYELLNSRASDVAEELSSVLQLIEGDASSYQVLGLERINALMIVSPPNRGFEEVTRWIRVLDAESQEQVEQLFVYKVKNLNAASLATTLTRVFGQQDEKDLQIRERASSVEASTTDDPLAAADQPEQTNNTNQDQGGAVSANLSVTIVADEDTNSLLVRATPREYRQLLTTISSLDGVPPQVLIHAVIGQVTLTDGTRFGIDWTRVSGNINSGPARLTSSFLPGSVVDGNGLAIQGKGLVLTKSFMDGSAVIDATLNAIAEDNEVRLLARPTILATNNQEGMIHVGQSVPVNNGTTIGNSGVTTENIAYQDVGINLKITPQINDDGYINLKIEQELSSVEEGAATGVAGNPTFTDQEISTTVVVADQTSITLGGLIQEEDTDQQTGVPGLQRIPGVGRLFSYTDYKRVRRELFVILRPQIINGDNRDDAQMKEFRDRFTNVSALLEESGL